MTNGSNRDWTILILRLLILGLKDILVGKLVINNIGYIYIIKAKIVWQNFQRCFTIHSFEYYEDGGPIFLQIGGEGEASPSWLSYGAWIDWAKEQKAALFILEHRFYGKSKPTDSLELEYLHLLSSRYDLILRWTSIRHIYLWGLF